MAVPTHDMNELKRRMQGAVSLLKQELGGLRTGHASNLGLTPSSEGQTLRLRIPELNEERRKELVKVAHKYAEAAKVAVRHVRRDGLDVLKKLEKDHKISEDDGKRQSDQVQKATDEIIVEIDKMLAAKEKEVLTV